MCFEVEGSCQPRSAACSAVLCWCMDRVKGALVPEVPCVLHVSVCHCCALAVFLPCCCVTANVTLLAGRALCLSACLACVCIVLWPAGFGPRHRSRGDGPRPASQSADCDGGQSCSRHVCLKPGLQAFTCPWQHQVPNRWISMQPAEVQLNAAVYAVVCAGWLAVCSPGRLEVVCFGNTAAF